MRVSMMWCRPATLVLAVIAGLGGWGSGGGQGVAVADVPRSLDRAVVAQDADFHVQGEYFGHGWGVQVMALGDGAFRAMVLRGGLPGKGWDRSEAIVLEGATEEGVTTLAGESDTQAVIQPETLWLSHGGQRVMLQRVQRSSPTLSAPPPEGAVVVFDGSSVEAFRDGASMTDDGLLRQGATTRAQWGDHRVHVEYLLAFMPTARDMGRANSGVYLQGRYEVQIVDSFGMPATPRLNAGIFGIAAPKVPAGLPPMRWQTLDIHFIAPRFDADGEKTASARLTVHHNGILVHGDVEAPAPTNAALYRDEAETGPVYLQDHGNPVRFRNVWVQPLDDEAEAVGGD